jgi:hypothetical protein
MTSTRWIRLKMSTHKTGNFDWLFKTVRIFWKMKTPTKQAPLTKEKENTPPPLAKLKSLSFRSIDSPPQLMLKKHSSKGIAKLPHKLESLLSPRKTIVKESPKQSPMTSPVKIRGTNYDNCIRNEEVKKAFREWSKEQCVSEQVEFILSVQKFKLYSTPMLRYKEARRIIHQHIKVGSVEEVNISYHMREDVLGYFGRSTEHICPDDIFDDTYVEVKMMMNDSWKIFVKTKEFEQIASEF